MILSSLIFKICEAQILEQNLVQGQLLPTTKARDFWVCNSILWIMKFSSLAGGSKHYHQTSVKVRYHSLCFSQMILYPAFRHFSHIHLWKTHRGPSADLQVSFWAILPSVPWTPLSPQPLSSVSSTEGGHQALRGPFSELKPINSLKTVS